jgi:hypothetical protein
MRAKSLLLCSSAALALAGCGDGRLSHATYVSRADTVCRAYDAKVVLLSRPKSFDEIETYVDMTLPIYVDALDKLRQLRPSKDDEAGVRAWLAQSAKVQAALRNLRAAAMNRDLANTNDASNAVQSASLAARQAAASLGLTDCATP